MRPSLAFTLASTISLAGCGSTVLSGPLTTSVTPSATGVPMSIASLGNYEFVSVQGTGEIFTYNISSGSQVLTGPAFRTVCNDPSGMVAANIAGAAVLAVACYDTNSLLTLSIDAAGSLHPLGSVIGLPGPYPGIDIDGSNVFVPLYGISLAANGGVARVDISSPAKPVVTAIATLASPRSGGFANPGCLTVAGGFIYVSAGSESAPSDTSSTLQVLDEASMTLVGSPFVVAHSPQQLTVKGGVAYVALYDAVQLESIDVSNPASLKLLQVFSLADRPGCHPLPVIVRDNAAYVGCYAEGLIEKLDITNPSNMQTLQFNVRADHPQHLRIAGNYLFVTSSTNGGSVSEIEIGPSN
jgi:hypothetical protein